MTKNKIIKTLILAGVVLMSGLMSCTHTPQVKELGRIYDRNGVLLVDNTDGKMPES